MAATLFWVIVGIAVFVLDLATSSFLFVWFTIGALAAAIGSIMGLQFIVQVIIFAIVGIISVCLGYPWAKKKFKQGYVHTPLMEETFIGRVLVAEENIENEGKIKVAGNYWTAKNVGEVINKGQKYTIEEIQGNKLIIKIFKEV